MLNSATSGHALNPARRDRDIEAATDPNQPLDVLVIGGGVTGAGVALDAASRGLRVAVLEQHDWAAGTSSRSSKLIHGGLRYLQTYQVALVREALGERGTLLGRIAPHLVHPIRFAYPLTRGGLERAHAGLGLAAYDTLAALTHPIRRLPAHRHHPRHSPAVAMLDPGRHHGAITYHDAITDDARYTLALIRTAAEHGAWCINKATVTELTTSRDGRITGATAIDTTTGQTLRLAARHTIITVGTSTPHLLATTRAHYPPTSEHPPVTPSKGTHLVLPGDAIPGSTGLTLRTDTSVLFAIPWEERWIIGTTDTPWHHPDGTPVTATPAEITTLLNTLNSVLATPVKRSSVIAAYAGLRPLAAHPSDTTHPSRISREHALTLMPGATAITGGKYTTYRRMAVDAVNAAGRDLPGLGRSRTARIPLVGAPTAPHRSQDHPSLALAHQTDSKVVERLIRRYGDQTHIILAIAATSPNLANPIPGANDHLLAEIAYACRYEDATSLEDTLERRTRISIRTPDHGIQASHAVAAVMAGELSWSREHTRNQLDTYRAHIAREQSSLNRPNS